MVCVSVKLIKPNASRLIWHLYVRLTQMMHKVG